MAEETVLIRFKSEDDASKTTKAVGDGLDDVGKKAGNAGKSFSSMQSVMSGVLQGIGQGLVGLAANLGSKALGAVTDFVGGAIEEASSWNSVMAQTEAVIASTGGAAGLTAKEMADMASEMSAASGQSLFSDDAILGAQNVLATFTNIKGENFGSATKSILDMSQALGMDLDSAAMQVGKALNDPVAGIAALSRSGVQFTADQEAMIKAMVEAGDTAGAQELMMKELNTQFGGSASAAVDTYAGQQIVLQEQFAGIQQTLGEALMPILMEFGKFMSDTVVPIIASVVTSLSNWITSMQQTGTTSAIFTTIKDAIAAVPSVLEQLGLGLERVKTFLTPLTDAINDFALVAAPTILAMYNAIKDFLGSEETQEYLNKIKTLFETFAVLIRDVLVLALAGLKIAWAAMADGIYQWWPFIKDILNGFMSLAGIVISFVTGILTALSQLVTGDFTGAWTTLKTTFSTVITDITGFFTTLDTKVKSVLNEIMGKFTEVGTNIATGIANGISGAAGKIADAARNAASAAYEAAKKFLGIESPSKLMRDQIGLNFSKGMATGILDGMPEVVSAASDTAAIGAAAATATVNNITLNASYANMQSESSLIADARAWMMALGKA